MIFYFSDWVLAFAREQPHRLRVLMKKIDAGPKSSNFSGMERA